MGPKKAAGSKSPSKSNKSPVKKTPATGTQSAAQATTQPDPAQPTPKPFTFKGHPQPPVDERLFAAKNFLADEDPNRCLGFDTKIAQIEEFIAQLEKDSVPCDTELFRDVKIKVQVHREWEARLKESPFDTGCCEAPLIPPFSTRLISAKTAALLRQEREAQGLVTQMRTDHAPFTVDPEEDHGAFLAKLREDASTDPEAIDQDTNLLWTESRAYLWAMRDPALIQHWMHPTQGIPTKGIRGGDARSRPHGPVSDAVRSRPARGWIPAHVAATEKKINELLKNQGQDQTYFIQLEELLCQFEPADLHNLHQQYRSFLEAADLGPLSANQEISKSEVKSRFDKEQRAWLNSLALNGVYLIVRTPGEPEVQAPGVLYVDDGIMTPEHLDTLKRAQDLLDRLLRNGQMDLTEEESASLDSLMQHSLPDDIRQVQKSISRILEMAGANSVSDLEKENQAKALELEKDEQELKSKWEESLKRLGGAEFWYLRPAEMKSDQKNILYLPWDLTTIPNVPAQARRDLQLSLEAQKLQEDINKDLARNINLADMEEGSEPFRRLLSQVVYPDLRNLLTPYHSLLEKEANPGLGNDERAQAKIIVAAVRSQWGAWWHGLGTRITVKMPFPEQQNKTPGVMYCRNPRNESGEDLETYFNRKSAAINQVLSTYAAVQSGQEPPDYLRELRNHCDDLQYSALKKLNELYLSAADNSEEKKKLGDSWVTAFSCWIQSKKGHTIRIKKPNPRIDPDDDPSVVYYRGPLLTPSSPEFQGMPESIRDIIRNNQAQSRPLFPADVRPQLPQLLREVLVAHEGSNTPESKAVLDWHLNAFMTAELLSASSSPSLLPSSRLPSSPQTSVTSLDDDNGHGNGNGDQDEDVVDFSALLPQIRAVESEINRILELVRNYQNRSKNSRQPKLEDYTRLTALLTQFFPDTVYLAMERAGRYRDQFESRRSVTQREKKEFADNVKFLDDAFRTAYFSWFRDLVATGIRVQVAPREALPLDRITLVFQPSVALIRDENTSERISGLLAPEVTTGPEVQTSQLVRITNSLSPSTVTASYSASQVIGLETQINPLLRTRRTSGLSWDESDVLLGQLRAVLPPYLVELDRNLRALDEKSRKTTLTGDELGDWSQMWSAWHEGYESWLNDLPSTDIKIAKGDQNDNQPGVLRLRVEDHQSLPPITRRRNLPLALRKLQDLINGLIATGNGLSDEDMQSLDLLLAPQFRPVLQRFRVFVHEHLKEICSRSIKEPEDDALIEATISLGHALLREQLFVSDGRIQIVEPTPGFFQMTSVDSSGAQITLSVAGVDASARSLYEKLCPKNLDAKKRFHDTALRIRLNMALSQDEIDFLMQIIPEIARVHILTRIANVVELLSRTQLQGEDINKRHQDTANAVEYLCWKRLMLNGDIMRKIESILDNPVLPNRTEELIARRPAGASPRAPPPRVAPPNEAEVNELEIEINNLLRGERLKTINKEQQDKLNYLLRALLPPRLRFLKDRISGLDRQYLAKPGLEVRDSLAFSHALEQFPTQFDKWKEGISDFGIILDPWYTTSEAIAEVCSRARLWKERTTNSDGSTNSGTISNRLQDLILRQWHDMYAILRHYVEDGCESRCDIEEQLLLRFMPQDLINDAKFINAETKSAKKNAGTARDTRAILLRSMKDQFIKSYVQWLISLTPMQFQRFQDRAKANYSGEINFTPKAERRGIQRAAIELALNLLGTNQEQHRPDDRFRIVDLPLPIQRPEKEVPLCLPLLPEDRPLEMDPFEYTRKMFAFRQWKDFDYGLARASTNSDQGGFLPAPDNYNGPVSIASVNEFHQARRNQLKNLAAINEMMIAAVDSAPRPLLQQLLLLVDAGLHHQVHSNTQPHPLYDDQILIQKDLELLEQISGDSWDEEACEYGAEIPGLLNTPEELGRLEEFEMDIAELSEIPLWLPAPDSQMLGTDLGPNDLFTQIQHDSTVPSTRWMTADEVRQVTGNKRMAKTGGSAGTPHLWDLNSVTKYLKAMASAGKIHLDDLPGGQIGVSRIPLSGHPENKYVISREDAPYSAGVRRDKEGKLEVRYDAVGNVGPPIVQPNKYHHLQQIAFRLGRDLKSHATVLAEPDPEIDERVQQQLEARVEAEAEMKKITPPNRSEDPNITAPPVKDITLERLAQDLHKIAPELAQEAGFNIDSPTQITERQAATLLQMQILDEASNNWEFKFPEKEHVWDFAAKRLQKTTRTINGRTLLVQPRLSQYFHMRRYPPCCQSTITKTAIKESGPTIQEEPAPAVEPISDIAATMDPGKQKARHIKGREPFFSLGESAYEKAFLSWRMDQELKDVPEFQVKKSGGWFSKFRHQKEEDGYDDTTDRYPLPKIPSSWVPDNVSIADKRAQVLELAKKTPAFPDPNILEYYHTHEEIEQIKLRREWDLYAFKRQVAKEKVEEHTKRQYDSLTPEELWKANAALGIDQTTGVFINDPPAKKGKGGAAKVQQSAAARRQSGPARNTRSKGTAPTMSGGLGDPSGNGKRTASGTVNGQSSPKRFKVI